MFLLGLDIGSSSIKAAIVDAATKQSLAISSYPPTEMEISAPHTDWAEQDPNSWWIYAKAAISQVIHKAHIDSTSIKAIGISYQMHGLVAVDKDSKPVRPSIIWCDSRAVNIGRQAAADLGIDFCTQQLLNSPGNFTASKLKWIKENEPKVYDRIHKIMLPGDYVALKMTGEISSTISGLSEGIFYNFKTQEISKELLDYFGIHESLLPDIKATFSHQGELTTEAANSLSLTPGIPVSYRAGDQPNNALSLGVFNPGQVAGTGGTSGVVYAVSDQLIHDPDMRVNSFAHVNYAKADPRIGVLLCINGCGIQYGWLRKLFGDVDTHYSELESMAASVPIGADNLSVISFGNGAERMLQNQNLGAQMMGLNFNTHSKAHLYRAGLEGIAFAFYYGMQCMQQMGVQITEMRVGNDNLFQSAIFSETLSTLCGAAINLVNTTGAVGAALGAGHGHGIYSSLKEAFDQQEVVKTVVPNHENQAYQAAYDSWSTRLQKLIKS